MLLSPLNKKAALPKPPEVKFSSVRAARLAGLLDIEEKSLILEEGFLHSTPSSFRTAATPLTMLRSFCLAAQRAVWLKPQSGAKESRSGAPYLRQALTRSEISADVSI